MTNIDELIAKLNHRLNLIPDDLRSSPNEVFAMLEDSLIALQQQKQDLEEVLDMVDTLIGHASDKGYDIGMAFLKKRGESDE